MKFLIVEGNPRNIWQKREAQGGVAYHKRFTQLLNSFGYDTIEIAFPSEGLCLPTTKQLTQFDGIVLTGSSLNIYDKKPEIDRQLDFAEHCFASGVPIYGSCWGLQVAVTVAGGAVRKSKKGREFGIAEKIRLTQQGKKSVFFADKPFEFDTYCIHEDDTYMLPENSIVLAQNEHSDIQALTLSHRQSDFFGVQYHPEFTYKDIEFLANIMQDKLTKEGIFAKHLSKEQYLNTMKNHATLNDIKFTTQEVLNWINQINS